MMHRTTTLTINANKTPPMTSDELNAELDRLQWTGAELSRRLRVTAKAVSEWRRGKRPVPGPVRAYVRLAAAITVALEGASP